jgi:arylsulfatase A-like enzyme
MRILYIDIDSLRPDHLGCYGYYRQTSPTIDRIAARGVRFTNY